MPLDVLGRTRATLTEPTSSSPWPKGLGNLVKLCRAGDRALQLLLFNEEFLVSASHQLALITSLPFVHTARRYYRLNGSVRLSDWPREGGNTTQGRKVVQTWSFRGSKSRNKVSVGEPAEGSLMSSGLYLGPISNPCISYLVALAGRLNRPPEGVGPLVSARRSQQTLYLSMSDLSTS